MPEKNRLFFLIWKILVGMVTVYVAIAVPLKLAFESYPIEHNFSNIVITVFFSLDFILNALRIKKSKKNEDCWEISDKPWFQQSLLVTDFLAAIPFEMFIPIPLFRLFRLFKLARLYNMINYIQQSLIRFAGVFILASFAFWFVLVTNALACGWHCLEPRNSDPEFAVDYINALYWTITTLTTVGYGDIIPVSNAQKIYAIFVQVFGFGVFTFIIGTVASQLMRKDPARERFEENMESLTALMHYKSLPWDLRMRIIDFYKYMWQRRLGYDETTFLQTLPNNLQTEVALHLKREVIEKVTLFKNASESFKHEIALLLKPIFVTPGDYIFKAGDSGNKMYFVVEGELETLTGKEDRMLTKLESGDFFGEIALFKNRNRSATIKAVSYCDIYTLEKSSFDNVISRYPEIVSEIKRTCEQREQHYSV